MSINSDTLMHYAMLIRLVSIMAISAFGVGVAILVPFLRRHLARLEAKAAHMPPQRLVPRG